MAVRVAAVEIVVVGCGGAGEIAITAEVGGPGGDTDEVGRGELVADPDGDFAGGVVAEKEVGAVGELAVWAGAGGQPKTSDSASSAGKSVRRRRAVVISVDTLNGSAE